MNVRDIVLAAALASLSTSQHAQLLGCRIARIGETEIADAQKVVGRLYAGNESWRRYKGPYFLTSPEILHGVGIAADPDTVVYDFRCEGENRIVPREPLPLERSDRPTEAWRDLSPARIEK